MNILFIGDVVGKPGREAVAALVPKLRKQRGLDLVIANGENSAHGAGLTSSTVNALLESGVDVITSGDHTWDQKEIYEVIEREPRLIRPLNFPPSAPGRGSTIVNVGDKTSVAVMNLIGRVFLPQNDCPFRAAHAEVAKLRRQTSIIIVDLHAEATSDGVVLDFIYDALDLKRSGLEYAAGTFHDIGKMILAELFPFAYFTAMNRSMQGPRSLALCETEMFGLNHAEMGANWLRENEFPGGLVDAIAQHETPARISRRAVLPHALVSANHLVKQIGIGYSGNPMLDPRPWEELPSTEIIWDARGNKTMLSMNFVPDILDQFESFPDLL